MLSPPHKPFRTNHAAGPNYMDGGLINDMAGALNMARLWAMGPPQHVMFGVAYVTDDADTCDSIQDESENNVKAPCFSQRKVMARFRSFNPRTGDYLAFQDSSGLGAEEDLPVDFSTWWRSGASSGPVLLNNDIFPCYYEQPRGMLVPLWVPMSRDVILDEVLTVGSQATASIYSRSALSSSWEDTEKDILVGEFDLNSGESYLAGIKGVARWNGTLWVFSSPACFADDTGL
jgi:hypothetical protein